MKKLLFLSFALTTATSLYSQKMNSKDVPAEVKTGLQKKFTVKEVDWDKEGDNYKGNFKTERK